MVVVLGDLEVPVPDCPAGFDEGGALRGGEAEITDAVVLRLEYYFFYLVVYGVVFFNELGGGPCFPELVVKFG